MRYMKGRMHFNKDELMRLEMHNPTLFELAKYVADKAHLRVEVFRRENNGWIEVYRECVSSSGKPCKGELACPSQVFHVPDMARDNNYTDGIDCGTMLCWGMRVDNQGNRPCWFRRWNDFVADMTTKSTEED